ncbi:hypothetical protein [Burkholderia cepacia]|uniref:hypothetical protein n=1 Tax=Burkholderia cepacia TaxID=292 RepID=UPI003132DDFF
MSTTSTAPTCAQRLRLIGRVCRRRDHGHAGPLPAKKMRERKPVEFRHVEITTSHRLVKNAHIASTPLETIVAS